MKNKVIEIKDLKCPSVETKCALQEMLKAQTTVSTSYVSATQMLTITVNGVSSTVSLA